jgi:predicted ATPase
MKWHTYLQETGFELVSVLDDGRQSDADFMKDGVRVMAVDRFLGALV